MQYGEIVTRSFRIAWGHRYLWFLAVLAGEGVGSSAGSGNVGNTFSGSGLSKPGTEGAPSPDFASAQVAIQQWITANLGLILAAAAVAILIWVALFLVSCVAAGAVVRASAEHDAERPFDLGSAWRAGTASFGRVLGLKLLFVLAGLLVLAVLAAIGAGGVLAYLHGSTGGLVAAVAAGLTLLAALIPIAILSGILYAVALRAVVLDQLRPWAGLRRAFDVMLARAGRVAITWLLSAALAVAAGFVYVVVFAVVGLPLVIILAVAFIAGTTIIAVAVAVIAAVIFVGAGLVAAGALGAYLSTYWTLAYRRFDLDPAPAPLPAPASA